MKFSFIPSLKILIPCLLMLCSLLFSFAYLYVKLPESDRMIENRYKVSLYRMLLHVQSNIEYLLAQKDITGVQREMIMLASNPEQVLAVLADAKQEIVAGSRLALVAEPLDLALPKFKIAAALQANDKKIPKLQLDITKNVLTGSIPVNFAAGQLGLLIIKTSMAKAKQAARVQLINQIWYLQIFVLVLALLTGFLFHFLFTRRINQLVRTAEAFAKGQLNMRNALNGNDELARLSNALNEMSQEISRSQKKLANDVIERWHAEVNLRESEASYRALFDANEDSVFIHDPETGAILDVNRKACETYGYSRAEFRTISIGDISSGEEPYTQANAAKIIRNLKETKPVRFEWRRKNKDGSLHWDDVYVKRAVIAGQKRVLAFTRDISERKKIEADRLELEAQLRQAQKMESIGQLTGGIAHDFNNILTSILGNTDLSLEWVQQNNIPKLEKYLTNIQRSGVRARDLIKQMLTFSRGQHGETCILPLEPLIDETIMLMRSTLPSSMELRTDTASKVALVRTDPVQIEQILMNLYINARDAMDGQGNVTISLHNRHYQNQICSSCRRPFSGDFVELSVKDNGAGIDPVIMDRIFEPFYSTKGIGKGSGMGLSMVHGIVHEHGGHLTVNSKLSKGSTFRMLFPAITNYQNRQQTGTVEDSHQAAPPGHIDASVLLVDDEPMVIEFMTDLLQSRGMDVIPMTNSEHALTLFRDAPDAFDLVITDQTMPKITGVELAQSLLVIKPDLPIILYTGHSEKLTEETVRQQGIQGFQKKPIDISAMFTMIRDLLNQSKNTA